jgi:hypothetical protein
LIIVIGVLEVLSLASAILAVIFSIKGKKRLAPDSEKMDRVRLNVGLASGSFSTLVSSYLAIWFVAGVITLVVNPP